MFKLIFSSVFLIVALLAALFGFLSGMRKKWQLNLMKVVTTVIAAIISAIVAAVVAWNTSAMLLPPINDILPADQYADISAIIATEAVSDSIQAIASMIIAPIFFLILFAIFKPLLSIANKPLARLIIDMSKSRIIEEEDKKPEEQDNLTKEERDQIKKDALRNKKITPTSSLVGALSGFLIFYIICIPSICGLSMVGEVASPMIKNIEGEYAEMASEIADASAVNAGSVAMKLMGGELIYNGLTTYEIDGHRTTLKNELRFVTATSNAVLELTKQGEEYDGKAVKDALDATADALNRSSIIPAILPEVLSAADAKWDNGETFCDISKPSIEESFDPATDALLAILGDQTYDTIKADIATVLDVVGVLAEDAPLSSLGEDPLAILSNKETNAKIFEALYENERLYKIVPAFAECGIQLMSDSLGIHEDMDAHYNDMAEAIIPVAQAVYNDMANASPDGVLSTEDYEEFSEKLAPDVAKVMRDFGIDAKAESCEDISCKLLKKALTGALSVDVVTNIISDNEIQILEADEVTVSTIKLTYDVFAQKTQLILADSITINHDKPQDIKTEAKELADAFATVATLANRLESEELTTKTIISDLGHLLDCFHHTHTIGEESSRNLLICMLQSKEALDTLKIELIQVTHLANHICDSASVDSYSVLLGNVVKTIDIIELATNNENIVENVEELIADLTPATVTTIQQISTPETMKNYGVPEESAEKTSELVSDIFTGLSDAKENNTLTEEEYQAEAEAVSDMINIAMSATKESSDTGIFGEESSTGITASDYIDRITTSKVMSQTIVDTVYDEEGNATVDPLNASINLTDDEKTELVSAMNDHIANTDASEVEDQQKLLIAAAALVNLNIEIAEDGTFVIPQGFPFN